MHNIWLEETKRRSIKNRESLAINFSQTLNNQDRSTTKLNDQFVHSQLLIDCLLRMTWQYNDKDELISFFREKYHDHRHLLAIIDEFERDYSPDRALWWYTRETFLYSLLNKALRTQDIDMLFLLRFWLRDIEREFERYKSLVAIRVYRGQLISNEEIQLLRESAGQLISFNAFLSTSKQREVALFYLGDLTTPNEFQKVLFEIDLDPRIDGVKPFADISVLSQFPSDQEVLIMLGSIFRFINILFQDTIWIIRMVSCNNTDSDVKRLLEYLKQQHGDEEMNLLSFAILLHEMGRFDDAEKYYYRLLKEMPDDLNCRSTCYHALGSVASEKGNYDTSLEWNYKSLNLRKEALASDRTSIAYNYNSIGVIYQKKTEYRKALEFYQNALIIWRQTLGENHPKIAMCLNNIGGVHHAEENYRAALQYHQEALHIWERHLPSDSFDLGVSHNNIGCIHGCLNHYDNAMEHFCQSIKIYQKSLPTEHAAIAKTLENIGLTYYFKEDLSQALSYYQQAATMYKDVLSSIHPKLQKIQQDIERVSNGLIPSSFHFWWLDTLKVLRFKNELIDKGI